MIVRTGTAPDSGTSARAYLSLHGSNGSVKRRRLLKGSGKSAEFVFLPGTTERFDVKGRDVGNLSHVTSKWVWLITLYMCFKDISNLCLTFLDRQMDEQADRQTDRQMDGQADRQTDRQGGQVEG